MLAAREDVMQRLEEQGYSLALEGGRLKVQGPAAPPPALEQLIVENRDSLAARALLSEPPAWLIRSFYLYVSKHETTIKLASPKGKAESYSVRLSLENIAASVATAIGMKAPEIADKDGITAPVRETVLPQVEALAHSWKPGKIVPFRPQEDVKGPPPPRPRETPQERSKRLGAEREAADAYERLVEERMAAFAAEKEGGKNA